MPISKWERKALIPFGACAAIARDLGCSRALVSSVVADTAGDSPLVRKIKVKLARRARRRVAELFPVDVAEESVSTPTEAPRANRAA